MCEGLPMPPGGMKYTLSNGEDHKGPWGIIHMNLMADASQTTVFQVYS